LAISIKAHHELGGSPIEAAEKLVNELPLFATATVSGVISALEEVTSAMDREADSRHGS
jgi:hypothetical protein